MTPEQEARWQLRWAANAGPAGPTIPAPGLCEAFTETVETGDVMKKDDGKMRYDLIPAYPLEELARVYTIGAKKYADRGWEAGMAWGRVFRALLSHAWRWWRGEAYDPIDGQHHLASVAWSAFALMEYEKTHPEHDNRPVGAEWLGKRPEEEI